MKGGEVITRTKKVAASVLASALLAAGVLAPTAAAQPIITGGLVNVTVVDALDVVITDVNVQVGAALALAANVCDVNVNVLATQLRNGDATCENALTGDQAIIQEAN